MALDVVINEIMFNPGSRDNGDEYVELYNRGDAPADLAGWEFVRGISYNFPGGTLGAGQYLVVAANVAKFNARYPGVSNVVGGWTGRLSNGGERIELDDADGVTVDQVQYSDQGDWATRGRQTFPLKTGATITRSGSTATVTLPVHELEPGDTVQISGANQPEYNGAFQVTGFGETTFTYTLSGSPAFPATGAITVRQMTDHGHLGWEWHQPADGDGSSLELVNASLSNNEGQNWKSSTVTNGTPGRANSVASANIAPMILDVKHAPVIPKPGEPVTITARLIDETAPASATVFYRVDSLNPGSFSSVAMRDNGTGGDAVASDGIWTAVLPAQQANGTIIEFYVSATDGTNARTYPAPTTGGTQSANLLYQVDNSTYAGNQPIFRLIMTAAERAQFEDIWAGGANSDEDSSSQMNGTLVIIDGVETNLRYQVGVRNRGHGSRLGTPHNFRINLPGDRPWEERNALNFNARYVHSQLLGSITHRTAGNAVGEAIAVQLRFNAENLATSGSPMYGSYVLVEEKDGNFAANHFPDDDGGNLYSAFRTDYNNAIEADLRYEGPNPNSYRDTYFKQTNVQEDDWSDLIHMLHVLNNAPDATYLRDVGQVINVEQWLRYLALDALMNNYETGLNRGIGDDFAMYRGLNDTRFVLVPHDLDTVYNEGNAQAPIDQSIFRFTSVDGLGRLLTHPDVVPLYYEAVLETIDEVFNPQVLNPIIDHHLGFVTTTATARMKQFVVDRRAAVLAQIPQTFRIDNTLPIENGYAKTTSPNLTLAGVADAARTRSVLVDGKPAEWNPQTGAWSITPSGGGGGTQTILARGSTWRYLDDGSNQGTAWKEPNFIDTSWRSGAAELGYGDTEDGPDGVFPGGTRVNFIDTDPTRAGTQKNFTTYFRTTFSLTRADLDRFTGVTLGLNRDDGASVWLNGKEVARQNLPGVLGDGTIIYTTPAGSTMAGADEERFFTDTINISDLREGTNVIAVEVHQDSETSTDISFDLTLTGQLPSAAGGIVLNPGINRVLVQAFDGLDGTGTEVERGFIDVWYDGPGGVPAQGPLASVNALEVVVPAGYRPGTPLLVEVRALDAAGKIQRDLWDASVTLSTDRADLGLSATQVQLHNGRGSILVTPTGTGVGNGAFTLTAKLGDKTFSRTIQSLAAVPVTIVSGTLTGTQTQWSGIVHVTGDVIVPAGQTLTIQPGTLVLLNGVAGGTTGADIQVNGNIQSLGTAAQPIVFTAFNPTMPWGELRHAGAQPSTYRYTQIHRAGSSPGVGHTNTGPAIRADNSMITIEHSSITDNVGKVANTGNGSSLIIRDSQWARSRMGPEITATALLLEDSWIYDMRGLDDGDGIYIHDQRAGQDITLRGGVVSGVDDDGIDTLRSDVLIDDYVVRGSNDKGISGFGGDLIIRYSLVADNSLAPEDPSFAAISSKEDGSNYGTVTIDHTTVIGRDIGIEVLDKYGAPNARIEYFVTNSVIVAPTPARTDYLPADIHVSYSNMFGGTGWPGTGNINLNPLFVDPGSHDFRLRPGSPSINAGDPASAADPDGSRADQGRYVNGVAGTLAPQTIPTGTLSGNVFLYPERGPYRVTGDVVVPAGSTLNVAPGTTVFFDAGAGITFQGGRLIAEGTELQQIRFTRTPAATGTWDGLQFVNSMGDNRIAYAVLEYGGNSTNNGMVGLTGSNLTIDHAYFDKTIRRRIRTNDSSLIVRNSTFTDLYGPNPDPATVLNNLSEHINGTGIPAGGHFIVENNVFGKTIGHNDSVDFDTATLPGPIPQFLNNVFQGTGDDFLDLECDAYIEANLFQHARKDTYNTDPGNSNAISAGSAHQYHVVRNTFVDVEHAVLVKEDSFLTFVNNTVVDASDSAIYFDLPGQTSGPGRGALVESSIFHDAPTIFGNVLPTTQITVNRSIVPASVHQYGVGNIVEDPRLADIANGDYSLKPGSPAIDSGLNGIDRGAAVPAGAFISGEPAAVTARSSATLVVSGPGITHYRYRLDGGAWSGETPMATPITLSGLSNGDHTVEVLGKTVAGAWQAQPTMSRTWKVDPTKGLRINEVLAVNNGAFNHGGTFPDMIELYNDGETSINLSGMSITDDPTSPRKFVFPTGTSIAPGQYLLLYGDNRTVAGELHIRFGLSQSGEGVYLYDTLAHSGRQIDAVQFGPQLDNLSIGRIADGSWTLNAPTIGAVNVARRLGDSSTLKVNEWLTSGVAPFADDFIELYNPDALPVALGGLFLTDHAAAQPFKHEIAPLSFVAGGGFTAFQADENTDSGPDHLNFRLSSMTEVITLLDAQGTQIDTILYGPQRTGISEGRTPDGAPVYGFFTQPNPGLSNPGVVNPTVPLRVTEINYNPPGGGAFGADDYEYIELRNVGSTPLSLSGFKFTAGINYTFGDVTLQPGQDVVLVKNLAAFAARYGSGINVVGQYTDDLDNNGEVIRLTDAFFNFIQDFGYSDAWYPSTDGVGDTLVIIDAQADPASWGNATSWKPSKFVLGAPGHDEPAMAVDTLVVNELLSNSDGDWIELRNTGPTQIDVGGWYVSDSPADPFKYRIAAGTVIEPGEFLVLDEATSYGAAGNPGVNEPFTLSELGEAVYISASSAPGTLSGYRHRATFDAAETGVSFGRYTTSTNRVDFVAMSQPTKGAVNAYPKVGPLVISEVMYNPAGNNHEFVELRNMTDSTLPLYDPAHPENAWRFTDGIVFDFPAGASIGARGYALVVPIDPALFRSQYGIPQSVQIFGPYGGALENDGETLEIARPLAPLLDGTVPYVLVERLAYGSSTPWPIAPNGDGPSLTRVAAIDYGNDVANWAAGPNGGTPGGDGTVVTGIDLVGTAGNDNWYLKRVGDQVHVWNNADGSGTAVSQHALGQALTLNGLDGDDTVTVDMSGGDIDLASLTITGANGTDKVRLTNGDDKTLTLASLPTLNGEYLDLGTADLKLTGVQASAVEALLKSARDGAVRWQGPGIGTSSATADTGLSPVQQGAYTLVKYSYNGDVNGDGRINADDYFRIDSGFLDKPANPLYVNGDFNFDDQINADDYFLIDSAFLGGQGAPLAGTVPVTATLAIATPAVSEQPQRGVERKRSLPSIFSDQRVRRRAVARRH